MVARAPRTALVTGGNRGIGFEVGGERARRTVRVVLTARQGAHPDRAAAELASGDFFRARRGCDG